MKVLLFGVLREKLGGPSLDLDPAPADVAALKRRLETLHPFLARHWSAVRVAVNQDFADDAAVLRDTDEVALIPPVAGGSGHPRVRLTAEPLSVDAAFSEVVAPSLGGTCLFAGLVRDHAHGQVVRSIEYSAYPAMALRAMELIVTRAEDKHAARVACHHRVGHLQVGEIAVVIVAAAAHRDAAFSACREVIEELKRDVPIWKRELGDDGATWVGMGP